MIVRASTIEEVQDAVRAHARLRPVAGGSKPALSAPLAAVVARATAGAAPAAAAAAQNVAVSLDAATDITALDVSGLSGIVDFSPAECVFSARPGTRIAELEALLAQHGLYLPFEPPLGDRGATLGGTIAAGLSGPGRFRYGGVRDFLLGVNLIDGSGRLVHGGGRVVKNAAGFSLHHLMLGSLGRLGVFVEVACKVFPRSPASVTLDAACGTLAQAVETMGRLRRSTFELDACELLPPGTLRMRVAGLSSALDERVANLTTFLAPATMRRLPEAEADAAWHAARQLTDIAADEGELAREALVKIAITPSRIAAFDAQVTRLLSDGPLPRRRYSAGGELAWLAWPGPLDALDRALRELDLSGLVLRHASATARVAAVGPTAAPAANAADAASGATPAGAGASVTSDPIIGKRPDDLFLRRVRQALDPRGVFA